MMINVFRLLYTTGQHSWILTEPNTRVEIPFTHTGGKINGTFLPSSVSRKYEMIHSLLYTEPLRGLVVTVLRPFSIACSRFDRAGGANMIQLSAFSIVV